MVAERLQERLCAELSKITKNIDFEDQDGNQSELSVFKQCLPRKENEDDSDPFPFCVVKLGENDVKSVSENQTQTVVLYFGLYYDKADCQYQHTMLTMMEAIKRRFLTNPILGEFTCHPQMRGVLDPEDDMTYPRYFAGMTLTFDLPNYEREDEFS